MISIDMVFVIRFPLIWSSLYDFRWYGLCCMICIDLTIRNIQYIYIYISYKEYITIDEERNLKFYRDMIDPATKNENTDQQKDQTREIKPNIEKKTKH